jgi:hypothetical protein
MQDYLIGRNQIGSIKHKKPPTWYTSEEWAKLDWVACATIWMHFSESVHYTVQLCKTVNELWKMMLNTYEKKVVTTQIYLIQCLYILQMKELDSITAHLNEYEGVFFQLSTQGMMINDKLKALFLMNNLQAS